MPEHLLDPQAIPTQYRCPVCGDPLYDYGKHLACDQKHSFDKHKKGYINLLLAHHKNSLSPGDNAEMVKGRQAFLRAGHYQPFADAIVSLLAKHCSPHTATIIDAGCGEGYYTEQLYAAFTDATVYGFDISKPAIHAAATHKEIHWSVASSHRPPFFNGSADIMVSIFSPIECDAFYDVLKPEGYLLYSAPGDQHLNHLKQVIYDEVKPYSTEKHVSYFDERFSLVDKKTLQVPIHLNKHSDITQLLAMTPHAHRISAAGHQRLATLDTLSDHGDFVIYLYQKNE